MRFLDTPSGTACVLDGDSRARPAGDRYIVLEPEDEAELILKRCPDLAASFKLINGAYHITYSDAMILFAGFLRLARLRILARLPPRGLTVSSRLNVSRGPGDCA